MTPINVCLACDDNYGKYAGVVIASVLANSKDDESLNFYILDGGISESKKTEMEEAMENSTIPDMIDVDKINELVLNVRKQQLVNLISHE